MLGLLGRQPLPCFERERDEKMPRGKSSSSRVGEGSAAKDAPRRVQKNDEWGGFVQITLLESDREPFDIWLSGGPQTVRRELDNSLSSGLKLTVTFDGGNQCYIASLTGRPDVNGERAFTCCLSARGGTFEEALAVLVYKHAEMLHRDWWEVVNAPKKSRFTFG